MASGSSDAAARRSDPRPVTAGCYVISIGRQMKAKTFTELVGCAVPLQLAGMGAVGAGVALPAAVCQAGGLAMLGAAGLPVDRLEQSIDELKRTASGPFDVNFLMPFLDTEAVALAAKKATVVEFFYGEPDRTIVELGHEHGALVSWQIGSLEEAHAAIAAGCDFIVAQGIEAGGHVPGDVPLDGLLTELAGAVSVPVVAAGGLGTAADVKRVLEAGVSGVRVGTRFLAAEESEAHPDYVDALIEARSADTVLTRAFRLGWDAPHRVLRRSIEAAERADGDVVGSIFSPEGEWPVPRFSTLPPTRNAHGNIAAMCMYAGTSVDGLLERKPAKAIVEELTSEL